MADELSVEDILAIEHDVIPLDGADVFQQGEIDSIGDRVALIEDPGDFRRLPVDDARQDQVQAAAGVHLLPQLAGVNPTSPPVELSEQDPSNAGWQSDLASSFSIKVPRQAWGGAQGLRAMP